MKLLRKACKRVWKRLSRRKAACKSASSSARSILPDLSVSISATVVSALPGTYTEGPPEVRDEPRDGAEYLPSRGVVNVTGGLEASGEMLAAAAAACRGIALSASWESDSGVCLVDSEEHEGEGEGDEGEDCWSEEGEDFECECDECSFPRTEDVLEDWHISAKDLALDKLLASQREERVYR